MSLQTELVNSLAFEPTWQEAVKNKKTPFANHDLLAVFRLIAFFAPVQHRYNRAETEAFVRLCFNCLIQHRINTPKDTADKELNYVLDELFITMGIDSNTIEAKDNKTSLRQLINAFYFSPLPDAHHNLSKKQ